MGIFLSGVAVKGRVEPSEDIVHFHVDGNTIIFLDIDAYDVIGFSTICEAHLLEKADFSEDTSVIELIEILKGKSFIVFHLSEHADMIVQEYAVVFKNGNYHSRGESIYQKFVDIGISFDFMYDRSFWHYRGAKQTYLTNKK